jgi:hypothetical protein
MRLVTRTRFRYVDDYDAVLPKSYSAVSENIHGTPPLDGLFHSMFFATSNTRVVCDN